MSPAVEARAQEAMNAELKQKQLQQQQQCFVEKGVMLEPFVHQVGGHSCVLRFGEQTICKPLIPREHQFYKSLPAAMRKFTPQYRGVVSVSFEEDDEGNLCLIAYPLHNDPAPDLEHKDNVADSEPKSKMCKWGKVMTPSLLVESEGFNKDSRSRHSHKDKSVHKPSEDVERLQQAEVLSYRVEYSHSSAAPQLKHNPWSLQCHQQHLQRMKENAKHRNQYKFILLENLTWQHTVPCVLDLKMGTRQHGDDASEEKKAMHMRKCEQSTSASIGVRLCGMQVYQSDTGQLMFMNKYLGRKLTLPGFKEALFQFFHSGHRLRHELLSPVLRRLRDMQDALESCESYRFYSSSLLIIYDGAPHRKHGRRRADAELSEEEEEEEEEEPEMEEEEDDVREVSGAFEFPHSPSMSSEGGSSCSSSSSGGGSSSSLSLPDSPAVDVRMIDFAHTTCRDFQEDSVIHEGGDSGYIFGLQNLITIISELESHNTD
ncbi:inositol hexakisphosphate kinase 2-like [Synchiropus splendidus]|uniref:inositol hexakisphosphate kinase 2-like n=1 Tax=Synchiropus splendidus TaxID=270530 RepID=UPI00237EB514|nr:inositol hexakisphosphate kinase 2-like [Synchiropus splendidus]